MNVYCILQHTWIILSFIVSAKFSSSGGSESLSSIDITSNLNNKYFMQINHFILIIIVLLPINMYHCTNWPVTNYVRKIRKELPCKKYSKIFRLASYSNEEFCVVKQKTWRNLYNQNVYTELHTTWT